MTSALRLVFANPRYVGLACAVFGVMFVLISALSEFMFFEPYFVFFVPDDRVLSFSLVVTVSVLSGVVIPMNVYLLKTIQKAKRVGGGFVGSLVGVSAGACSCGPVGFSIISTFGTAGGLATAFLANYEIPLRLASVAILGLVYYTTTRTLNGNCKI